jgi:hypothetical protein
MQARLACKNHHIFILFVIFVAVIADQLLYLQISQQISSHLRDGSALTFAGTTILVNMFFLLVFVL